MSATEGPRIASYRTRYGKKKVQLVAAAVAPGEVLNFGQPVKGEVWVVHRIFIRSAAGQTVRLIVGSDPGDPGNFDPADEVDAVTANPAVSANDEITVEENEPIWALVSGVIAGVVVSGQIRYRRMLSEGTY